MRMRFEKIIVEKAEGYIIQRANHSKLKHKSKIKERILCK